MMLQVRRERGDAREGGFTLVEMVVTVTVIAVVFTAAAVMLDSGLRALAAAKARARGNDVATQGIEDLQRFGFNSLGLCGAPSGTAPAGLSDTVVLANCPAPPTPVPYEEPCNGVVGTVPKAEYTCIRNNVTYTVKRYVAWVDTLRTTKRLAVFVEWDDLVGRHQVSQQSSLRAPDQSAITGLAPPKFSSTQPPTATPLATPPATVPPLLLTAGKTLEPGYSIKFDATTENLNAPASTTLNSAIPTHVPNQVIDITVATGAGFPGYNGFPVTIGTESFTVLSGAGTNSWRVLATGTTNHPAPTPVNFAGDRVYATIQTIGSNNSPQASTVFLDSVDGVNWSATLGSTSTFQFGAGSQYVPFGILRASDGKSTSAFADPALTFCPSSAPDCAGLSLPSVTITQAPTFVDIGASGELVADVVLKVDTTNITNVDTVTVAFLTQAGSVSVVLTQDPGAAACPAPDVAPPVLCSWIGTISMATGYRFATGTQSFYFGAAQVLDSVNPATVDKGSTGVAVSPLVPFG